MTTPKEDPDIARIAQEWVDALERLSEEDERLLALLAMMGEVIDPRYEIKGIRVLVGRALVDPAFRARVLDDADPVLSELRGHVDLPDDVRVRFVENSADYLTIVLPPPSEALTERSRSIRDLIFSRTSAEFKTLAGGVDDNDIAPLVFADPTDHGPPPLPTDHTHFGDASHDG